MATNNNNNYSWQVSMDPPVDLSPEAQRTQNAAKRPRPLARLRYTRVKDVGTRLTSVEQRNKRIATIADPLPEGNELRARSVYWFVTTEPIEISFQDTKLFNWKETAVHTDEHGVVHYLYQVGFNSNKMGLIAFHFPNGEVEPVVCRSTAASSAVKSNANKKMKLSSNSSASGSPMQLDEESQSADYGAQEATPQTYASNTNQVPYHPYATLSPSAGNLPSPSSIELEALGFLEKSDKHVQVPPVAVSNSMQVPSNEALIVNILLLVPGQPQYIQMIDAMLLALGFTKEVSSANQQNLYSQKRLNNTTRHVLLFPYGREDRYHPLEDCLPATSEVILFLENEAQEANFTAVAQVTNIDNDPNNNWPFIVKCTSFGAVEFNYQTLNAPTQLVLSIDALRRVVLGGASWKKSLSLDQLAEPCKSYFLKWTLARVEKHVVQNIYICFKFEPRGVRAFTDYAISALEAIGIEYELDDASVVHGSVLVYLRCPAYVPWYILQRQQHIFDTLTDYGLTKIYECFISDVEASMQRVGNEEFVDELTFLREQMISDGIAEQATNNKFCLLNPKLLTMAMEAMSSIAIVVTNTSMSDEVERMEVEDVPIECPPTIGQLPIGKRQELEEKWTELKKFDNKLTKTLEDCYNKDKLLQQLFTFKQEKNVKIAVRVFISSASAGLATNVAKLMRKFNGKSIVDGVHSGLQIANTIVEWNQSGIVHIGELKHANAVAVLFDVQDSVKFDFTDDVAQKMVSFIQKWNTEHRYSSDEFNSHRFVRDFLQYTMNISLVDRFQGPLGYFMDHVMRTGDATPRLFSKNNGVMVFKTHEELEETERAIKSKLSEDELKLMKIFHRGFQLQEAANGKDVSSCSYGLPTNGLEILNDSGKPMKY
eukprot:TRINITY_DN557_c0_g1_i2.p1 TRINITY_DN557_c0_g1~~TRINITY_DN557_c0_g1_i2.p1  ORF type:complete len:882 (-),score=159.48 TRINITY_DN557_c0_g1_i2:115-2760(-)